MFYVLRLHSSFISANFTSIALFPDNVGECDINKELFSLDEKQGQFPVSAVIGEDESEF